MTQVENQQPVKPKLTAVQQIFCAWPLVLVIVGGAIGGAVFGWFMYRFGIKKSTLTALGMSCIMLAFFGLGQSTLLGWGLAVVAVGLFTNSAIVGFYSAWAAAYPTHMRATGTGFALSIGRGGAALSPYLAGTLFKNDLGLMTVSLIMAVGSLIAMALLSMVDMTEKETT